MNNLFFWLFLRSEGRRIRLPQWVFTVIKLLFFVLVVAVFLYTLNLFLTLPERVHTPHVHTHSNR